VLPICLIQPGEGTADTRRRTPLDDLVPAGSSRNDIQALLKPLVDERLVTTERDEASGEDVAEISHDALIQAWQTLAEWIEDGREDIRFQLQLGEAIKNWEDNDEDTDFLLRGLQLANAEAWLARARPQLTEPEDRFLTASRNRARRSIWFRRGAVALLVALTIFALAAGVAAVFNAIKANEQTAIAEANAAREVEARQEAERQKRRAQTEALAGHALNAIEVEKNDPSLALVLARDAVQAALDEGEEVSSVRIAALLNSVRAASPWQLSLPPSGHKQRISVVSYSPDGDRILSGSFDDTARIWDAASGDEMVVFDHHAEDILAAAWNPDDRRVFIDLARLSFGIQPAESHC